MNLFRSNSPVVASVLRTDSLGRDGSPSRPHESAQSLALKGRANSPSEPSFGLRPPTSVLGGANSPSELDPEGRAIRPCEPSSVVANGDRGDVVTNDIMFSKVSGSPVFTTAVCASGSLSLLYIIFINSNNNVIMSSAPVCRGFVGDIVVTLSLLVPFLTAIPDLYRRLPACLVFPVPCVRCLPWSFPLSNFQFQISNPKD